MVRLISHALGPKMPKSIFDTNSDDEREERELFRVRAADPDPHVGCARV